MKLILNSIQVGFLVQNGVSLLFCVWMGVSVKNESKALHVVVEDEAELGKNAT